MTISLFRKGNTPSKTPKAVRNTIGTNQLNSGFIAWVEGRALLVRTSGEYALEERGRSTFFEFRTYTPNPNRNCWPTLDQTGTISFDIMTWMWNHPGKVIEHEWGDEHFLYMLHIVDDEHYLWMHWGSQDERHITLTKAESEYIIAEIMKIPHDRPELHCKDEKTPAILREPEPYELPGGCTRCEIGPGVPCEQDGYGQQHTRHDLYTDLRENTNTDTFKSPKTGKTWSEWTRTADGRWFDGYGRGHLPFENGSNRIDYDYMLSGTMVTTRYYPERPISNRRRADLEKKSPEERERTLQFYNFQDAMLYVDVYESGIHIDGMVMDVAEWKRVAAIPGLEKGTIGTPIAIDLGASFGHGDWQCIVSWDEHGVEIGTNYHFQEHTGRVLLPWPAWNRIIETLPEFEAWHTSGED